MRAHHSYNGAVELPAQEALAGTIKAEGSLFFKNALSKRQAANTFDSERSLGSICLGGIWGAVELFHCSQQLSYGYLPDKAALGVHNRTAPLAFF